MTIFVTSDLHLGHRNILNFLDEQGKHFRNFQDVEEMNELIVKNWNDTISDSDIVYNLGDVYFGDGYKHLSRLKGRKRLILGNHDDGKDSNLWPHFQKILMWRIFKEEDAVLTHVPVHSSSMFKVHYNIHGHIHEKKSPGPFYINASVEAQDYRPKLLSELIQNRKRGIDTHFEK